VASKVPRGQAIVSGVDLGVEVARWLAGGAAAQRHGGDSERCALTVGKKRWFDQAEYMYILMKDSKERNVFSRKKTKCEPSLWSEKTIGLIVLDDMFGSSEL
jgi:hypothetical protein